VWAYDGSTWTQVISGGGAPAYIDCMVVHGGLLFAGGDGEVWAFDGVSWVQVNEDGFGDPDYYGPFSMVAYNDTLYAGGGVRDRGATVWAYRGGAWAQVNDYGFGDLSNAWATTMAVFDGSLYVGTYHWLNGTEIWSTALTSASFRSWLPMVIRQFIEMLP